VPMATREYFPPRLRAAIRQRSRWVAGIVLQGWERHGWCGPWPQVNWFWRDRKGLIGNLLSPIVTALFVYGAAGYSRSVPWHSPRGLPSWVMQCSYATLAIWAIQILVRMFCCARVYGCWYAAGVPLRMLWGNLVNWAATLGALRQFRKARRERRKLAWLKTDHDYPSQVSGAKDRPRVGEILVKMRFVSPAELDAALKSLPEGRRIGEHLIYSQRITEENLYQALSSQGGIPLGVPDLDGCNPLVTRVLPAAVARKQKVIPFRIAAGELHVLTCELPSRAQAEELSAICKLGIRFRLVLPAEFADAARKYLP